MLRAWDEQRQFLQMACQVRGYGCVDDTRGEGHGRREPSSETYVGNGVRITASGRRVWTADVKVVIVATRQLSGFLH